jgi:hypothetical protein
VRRIQPAAPRAHAGAHGGVRLRALRITVWALW